MDIRILSHSLGEECLYELKPTEKLGLIYIYFSLME
jgi:hypothetical protein